MAEVGIAEAARLLGVSEDTVRRRLKRGELQGTKVARPQGFTWAVELARSDMADGHHVSEPMQPPPEAPAQDNKGSDLLEFLQEQIRVKDGQIGELVHTIREMQTYMLPAPKHGNSWWRRVGRLS